MVRKRILMKTLYQQIEEAIRHYEANMTVPDGTTQDEVYQSIRQIMRENPDIFWFSHQWRYTEDDHTIRFRYTISKEKSIKTKAQIDNVVEHDFLINDISQLTQAEKVMVVYKWVAMYCKYNGGEVTKAHQQNRLLLQRVMKKHGFKPYANEWWHFTLNNEPYPKKWFNFPVK